MTLYLKYRPQKIADLDLESVRDILQKIVTSQSIPHAFLFAGPKGTGKTSSARILAKVLNCENPGKSGEPCNKCDACKFITNGNHIDVIEMDAASNRGIDDIRSLREQIILAPSTAKKKVYIIDEAHMLTTEASNAFLKTLEEPPEHAVFILATTDPQKLPETVRSRLTTVQFQKATDSEISRQLSRVIEGEKLKVEDGVINIIAKSSDGSFRDAVKIFETLLSEDKNMSLKGATKLLSRYSDHANSFTKYLLNKDKANALSVIEKAANEGVNMKNLIDATIENLRTRMEGREAVVIITLIEYLFKAKKQLVVTPIAELPLEMVVYQWCNEDIKSFQKKSQKIETKLNNGDIHTSVPAQDSGKIDRDNWAKLLLTARENASIDALLRACEPISYDGKTLEIGVFYRFHKERLEENANKRLMEDICRATFGSQVNVNFQLTERSIPSPRRDDKPLTNDVSQDIIQAAEEIFG